MEQEKESMDNANWKKQMEERLTKLEHMLEANNSDTAIIREILEYARGFFKFCRGVAWLFGWAAKLATWGLALYAAFYALTHGGKQP